ncbi:AraC family transcriptional regulator [Paenibacillus sp. PSB04]|uniref:AraC family transcriptional regulator n=1 Tax=Paenibacillus sp. PSB04 TaxID=2866810 RepID=UPI0021F16ED3|nr:AraC family transcriptional regulator [Paenibacillus sp. PSB04]UYO03317.1 AraC family transcriptional regulator [Paenibacillus sp. PSB04]
MDHLVWGAALSKLHSTVGELTEEDLCIRIHYWGALAEHRSNLEHKHSFFEMCYVAGGEGTYVDEGRIHPLAKGTLFISNPYRMHRIESTGMQLIWLAFDVDARRTSAPWNDQFARLAQSDCYILHGAENSPAVLLWKAIMQAAAELDTARFLLDRLVLALVAALPQTFTPDRQQHKPTLPPPRSASLRQALQFIRDNLESPLKLEDVARYFHISGRHLARLFQKELKMTFTAYVRQERIRLAAYLLRETDRSVKEIADLTGFGSVHYFTRMFSAAAGIPPAAYRIAPQQKGMPFEEEHA